MSNSRIEDEEKLDEEIPKRKIPPKKKKRTLKRGRIAGVGAIALSGLVLYSAVNIKNLINNLKQKKESNFNLSLDSLDGQIDDYFDSSFSTSYYMGESFELYTQGEGNGSISPIDKLDPYTTVNVYSMVKVQGSDAEYYYCDVPEKQKAGLINSSSLGTAMKTTTQYSGFDQVYLVQNGINIKATPDESRKNYCIWN